MAMLIAGHVFIALLSVAISTFCLLRPTRAKLRLSYGLAAATLVSGSFLVIGTKSPLLPACSAGLVYLAVIFVMLAAAKARLAKPAASEQ